MVDKLGCEKGGVSGNLRVSSLEAADHSRPEQDSLEYDGIQGKRAFTLRRKVNFHSCSRRISCALHLTTPGYPKIRAGLRGDRLKTPLSRTHGIAVVKGLRNKAIRADTIKLNMDERRTYETHALQLHPTYRYKVQMAYWKPLT